MDTRPRAESQHSSLLAAAVYCLGRDGQTRGALFTRVAFFPWAHPRFSSSIVRVVTRAECVKEKQTKHSQPTVAACGK